MFPVIKNINDVLPHIEGDDSFVVLDKGDYTVIDYVIEKPTTFPPLSDGLSAAIRRECRGVCFTKDGKIARRGLQKFHNVNQTEEAQAGNIDWSKPCTLMNKLDGSLIFPLYLENRFILGTRKGATDVAALADEFVKNNTNIKYNAFIEHMRSINYTPFFEFCCWKNMIVIDYGEPHMTLLAARNMYGGAYMNQSELEGIAKEYSVPSVEVFNVDLSNPTDFLVNAKNEEGKEGYVIRFDDGYTVKVKGDWYVNLHKVVDSINSKKNIVKIIMDKTIDDILPSLPKPRQDYINEFIETFFTFREGVHYVIRETWKNIVRDMGDEQSRKDWAIRIQQEDKYCMGLFFKFLDVEGDNNKIESIIDDFIYSKTRKENVFDEFVEWSGFEL